MRAPLVAGHALVVGNTDGIGLALTKRLLELGWTVVGISRRPSLVAASRYAHVVADVSGTEYRSVLESLHEARPAFDVCVYCAGIGELFDPLALQAEAQVFRVNLVGAVATVEVVLASMIAAGRGHLLALSSIGDGISASAPSYAASKAGLSSYFAGLALALRSRAIHVTNVRFGFVRTKMAKAPSTPFSISSDEACAVVLRAIARRPMRVTYPKRMAALMWLLQVALRARLWFG